MLVLPPQRLLSTIVSKDGLRYQIKSGDLPWLARMVKYEGGVEEAPALLWTLAQRFAWIDRGEFPTLAALAQSFSQPINPIWRRDGSECKPGGRYHGAPDCSESRLARRDRAANESWRSLDDAVTTIVVQWAMGEVLNPVPRAANWAASRPLEGRSESVAVSYLRRVQGSVAILTYGNTFIAEPKTRNWSEDHVALNNRDGSVTTTVRQQGGFLSAFNGLRSGLRFA